MNQKLKLALVLFFLGFTGVLSLLTTELPLPGVARELLSQLYTNGQIKGLLLVNPILFLILGILLGIFTHKQIGLSLPVIEALLSNKKLPYIYPLLIIGVGGGLFTGLIIILSTLFFQPFLPAEFLQIGAYFRPNMAVRLLYGGFTEEIIVRFGLMTAGIWLLFRVIKRKPTYIYWIGILFSSLLFALMHLPMVYAMIGQPSPMVFGYIMLTNTMGGIVFGWLYWRKGLETAMLAHMITHVVLIVGQV
ncbi:MAG: CPBP family intramembrane glutamic endopeptidase [Flavobacteriaceae bacterium]